MIKKLLSITLLLYGVNSLNAQVACTNATTLIDGNSYIVDTVDFNNQVSDLCGESYGYATGSKWFKYVATSRSIITVNAVNTENYLLEADTFLNVYSGTCGNLQCVTSNDDYDYDGDIYLSYVNFIAEAGTTYYFEWTNEWDDTAFSFLFTTETADCTTTYDANSLIDFEDIKPILCWDFIDADGDGSGWTYIQYEEGNNSLSSFSYDINSESALFPDNWAISLPVNLSNVSAGNNILLKWKVRAYDPDYANENYSVYVATSNDVLALQNSTVSTEENIFEVGGLGVQVGRTLDISSFAGQTVYIAFRHHGVSDQFVMDIDDIEFEINNLSNNDFNQNNFKIYPNPTTNILNVQSTDSMINSVIVMDLNGRTVKSSLVNATETQINVADLNTGLYMVVIESEFGSTTQKFIKQ